MRKKYSWLPLLATTTLLLGACSASDTNNESDEPEEVVLESVEEMEKVESEPEVTIEEIPVEEPAVVPSQDAIEEISESHSEEIAVHSEPLPQDNLAEVDTNGNGKVTIQEAKDAGYQMPIKSDHWLYEYMDDRDGDGMVGE